MSDETLDTLPAEADLPDKLYFRIGEVAQLVGVDAHVLRYWEAEFPQLKPVKRRGNRRYYRRGDVELVRAIRGLLYEEGYTIGGARQRLTSEDGPSPVELMTTVRDSLRDLELARGLLTRDTD